MSVGVLTSAKIQLAAGWTGSGTEPGAFIAASSIAGTLTTAKDISAYCSAVSVPSTAAQKDATVFASVGFTVVKAGLKSASLVLTLMNDYAASALESIVYTTLGGVGSYAYFDVMPDGTASRGATNPSYVGYVLISDWDPVAVSVGEIPGLQVTWPCSGSFGRLVA